MNPIKLLTVVGTRPEIIRLSRVLSELDASPAIEHTFVHTGQNYDYELSQIFFEDLSIRKPDYFLEASCENTMGTIGNILIKIDDLLEEIRPDAFLVLGDTNSCLCAIAAKKRKIPIFHMEAGNRCFDQRVPEESNRKVVDHIADINLTYSDIARSYLIREGIAPDRIIKTGSPMYEVLNFYLPRIKESSILIELGLSSGKYFLVSAHREENISNDQSFGRLMNSLNEIAEKYDLPIVVSTHPRTRQKLDSKKLTVNQNIRFLKPLAFTDYNHLQLESYAVLSDSGTISEESSILNFRALNIRDSHERPEAMEEASVMMVGTGSEEILRGLAQVETQNLVERDFRLVADYSMPNVSHKITRIILSYTQYVNRVVWGKNE